MFWIFAKNTITCVIKKKKIKLFQENRQSTNLKSFINSTKTEQASPVLIICQERNNREIIKLNIFPGHSHSIYFKSNSWWKKRGRCYSFFFFLTNEETESQRVWVAYLRSHTAEKYRQDLNPGSEGSEPAGSVILCSSECFSSLRFVPTL